MQIFDRIDISKQIWGIIGHILIYIDEFYRIALYKAM